MSCVWQSAAPRPFSWASRSCATRTWAPKSANCSGANFPALLPLPALGPHHASLRLNLAAEQDRYRVVLPVGKGLRKPVAHKGLGLLAARLPYQADVGLGLFIREPGDGAFQVFLRLLFIAQIVAACFRLPRDPGNGHR